MLNKKTNLFYVLTLIFLVMIIIVSISYFRYTTFISYQKNISEASTQGLSNQIKFFIEEQQRQVRLFAYNNASIINKYLQDPDNSKIEQQLETLLSNRFTSYFSFTIIDKKGNLYRESFGNKINDLCKADIKVFTSTRTNLPRIHPNADMYHFDVMANLKNDNILFVNFNAELLGKIISNIQSPGHQLIIALEKDNVLIEVTEHGPRNKVFRPNYNLDNHEKTQILSSLKIPSTQWSAIDLYKEEYIKQKQFEIMWQSLAIFGVFILFLGLAVLPFFKII